MLNKHVIPVSLWEKTQAMVVGLGNIPNDISFQIPEAVLCFQDFCLKLKFLLADIPCCLYPWHSFSLQQYHLMAQPW
jgi:hypothetical protein